MANISSAKGTLTLVGNWAPEDIELANQVVRAWEFHGEFGMSLSGTLSPENMSGEFRGTGRWTFESMLEEEFDRWTRDWIKSPSPKTKHPLSAGVYDALLEVMFQKNLRIKALFYDTLEEGGCLHRSGHFISDGRKLDYAPKGSQKEKEWEKRQLEAKGVLTKYEGPGGDVVIKPGYTEIGKFAFSHRYDLTSVVIPEGVQKIGMNAFSGCDNLTSVILPNGLKIIDSSAFQYCKSLTGVVLPESVKKIDREAFLECKRLKNVTIPPKMVLGANAFKKTPWLRSLGEWAVVNGTLLSYRGSGGDIEIPEHVKIIDESVFQGKRTLTSVTFLGKTRQIKAWAFQSCTNLTSVTLPPSVKTIGYNVFEGCKKLTIHAPAGSAAEEYAQKNKIKFEALP